MRLSDAGMRCRPTKLIHPNYRLPSLAHRRRDPRALEPIVRSLTLPPILVRPMEPAEHETQPVRVEGHQDRATLARHFGKAMRRILPRAEPPEGPLFCREYPRNGTTLHSRDGPEITEHCDKPPHPCGCRCLRSPKMIKTPAGRFAIALPKSCGNRYTNKYPSPRAQSERTSQE